jgi:hypothetical protein
VSTQEGPVFNYLSTALSLASYLLLLLLQKCLSHILSRRLSCALARQAED